MTVLKQPEYHELITLGENLNRLMFEKKVDSKEVSALTGISVSSLNALKRGEGNPTLGTLVALANFFDVRIDQLIAANMRHQSSAQLIPVYDLQNVHQGKKVSPKTHVSLKIEADMDGDDYFAVKIDNASLMPFFDKGSIFILSNQKPYSDGDMVLVRINNEYNVLRKVFVKNKGLLFHYIALDAKPHTYDQYQVLGIVCKVIHNLGI